MLLAFAGGFVAGVIFVAIVAWLFSRQPPNFLPW